MHPCEPRFRQSLPERSNSMLLRSRDERKLVNHSFESSITAASTASTKLRRDAKSLAFIGAP